MHVAILGNGIAGITAARELRQRQSAWRISVISGESAQHFSRPALMYVYMGHMRFEHTLPYEPRCWSELSIELVHDWVRRIDVAGRRLELERGAPIVYDRLLLATGAQPSRYGWPGQDLKGVQGLVSLQDLGRLEQTTATGCRRAVIVGGGLIAIELAEMLHSRGIPVTFLVREDSYWNNVLPAQESALVSGVIRRAGFDLRLGTELERIEDDGRGRACAVVTKAGERIECDLVGLTAGVTPALQTYAGSEIPTGRGVLVDECLRTSVPGVLAAGDCAEIAGPQGGQGRLEQLWYTGRLQGAHAARVLCGESAPYQRGVWFNSAKFLDLEYQTYGLVNMGLEGGRSLYWEDPAGPQALRIVYTDEAVIGMDVLGIRHRHQVWERWIRERRGIGHVLEHLHEANFDPEFTRRNERGIARAWRDQLA